ncbi:hypothetical protein KTQ74_16195 [Pseudomonas chlororaphis]|uniref:hypothetical protein n=1 Tax=Pseudomonas chlororaphis TaxID=587753 RepID=UPI001E5CFC30|nr:hypothetical protein [Pseudomonas chlororaphis]MCB2253448.1 hypothetical protein [Pseudomonas chlororaphis]
MPTENRSSNTEMVSVPRFSLEAARDCLVTCQDQAFQSCECESCPQCGLMPDECTDTECSKTCQCTTCDHCMNKDSIDSLTTLLVQPAPQPHAEPIAWMVGTAIWWTKEEAERDAAATGLPIIAVGPITDTASPPVECIHEWTDDGEFMLVCTACGTQENHDPKWRDMASAPRDGMLVRLLVEFTEHATEDSESMPSPTIGANSYDHTGEDVWQFAGWSWEQDCFTQGAGDPIGWLPLLDTPHTDPCEVERLRQKEAHLVAANRLLMNDCDTLRAQLADLKRRHDGLHRDMATIAGREVPKGCTVADYAAAAIADAISASAEPSAPVERAGGDHG